MSQTRELLQVETQAPDLFSPSMCTYCPRIPHVFEKQKNETSEQ